MDFLLDIDINEKCNNRKLPFEIESKIPEKTKLVNILGNVRISFNLRIVFYRRHKVNGKGVKYILKNVDSNETIVLVRKKQRYQDCKILKLVQAGRTFLTHIFFRYAKRI